MNEKFYERCKKVVANLDLTYEQEIARDVILNELDMLEKQAQDYQERFNKAIKYIKNHNTIENNLYEQSKCELLEILGEDK